MVLKYSCCVICFPISLPATSAVVAIRCGQKCRLGSTDWVQRTLCILEEDKTMSSWKQKAAPLQCNSPVSPAEPCRVGWMMLRAHRSVGSPGQDIPAWQQPCPHLSCSCPCTSSTRSCISTPAHLGTALWGHLCSWGSSVTGSQAVFTIHKVWLQTVQLLN